MGELDVGRGQIQLLASFSGAELDPRRWVAHYLPQWTTPDRSAARYELEPGVLRLRIDADQPEWRVEDAGDAGLQPPDRFAFGTPGLAGRSAPPPRRLGRRHSATDAEVLHALGRFRGSRAARQPRRVVHARLLADRLRGPA